MVRDRGGVAFLAVPAPARTHLFRRRRQRPQAVDPGDARERQPLAGCHLHVGQVVAERERFEHVAHDLELTGDVRAREADLAQPGEHVLQGLRRTHDDAGPAVAGTEVASVVTIDADRDVGTEEPGDRGGEPEGTGRRGASRLWVRGPDGILVNLHGDLQ